MIDTHVADVREPLGLTGLLRACVATRTGIAGVTLIALVIAVGAAGPFLRGGDPEEIGVGPPAAGPSWHHLLGTDTLGRDVFARVLSGGTHTLLLPLAATTLAFAVGGLLGLALGYRGGRFDLIGSRLIDVLLGLPPLVVVLVLLAGLGIGYAIIVIAIAVVFAPRVARVVRGATRVVATQEYVLAAQGRGERLSAILVRELAPNILPTLLVDFALRLTYAVIFIASLSFLGLGAQPPTPDWGLMASENRAIITVNAWATVAPAAMIGLLAMGTSFITDSITEHYAAGPAARNA